MWTAKVRFRTTLGNNILPNNRYGPKQEKMFSLEHYFQLNIKVGQKLYFLCKRSSSSSAAAASDLFCDPPETATEYAPSGEGWRRGLQQQVLRAVAETHHKV
jgi:hypothetical protein